MTKNFEFDYDADHQWLKDLSCVFHSGKVSKPRGMKVFELIGYTSIVDMRNPIIFNPHREIGYKFMAAEAAWILTGQNDVASIAPFSKEISKFSDDGKTFFGAYGPKVRTQLDYVIHILSQDKDSRQAVINIWRENPPVSKDIPCTLSLQFILRNDVLHCIASMRSSDLWLGHPYDVVNFSAIAFYVSLELREFYGTDIHLGRLHLTAGSKHIYERNIESVGSILERYTDGTLEFMPRQIAFDSDKYLDGSEFVDSMWSYADSDKGLLSIFED